MIPRMNPTNFPNIVKLAEEVDEQLEKERLAARAKKRVKVQAEARKRAEKEAQRRREEERQRAERRRREEEIIARTEALYGRHHDH